MSEPLYEWHITVRRLGAHGSVEGTWPAVIFATTKLEVTEKVRTAFGATYDDFRKSWSHDWTLREVREIGGSGRPASVLE